jgi:hypothetical protein
LPGVREPGLTWVNPFADRLRKVNRQVVTATLSCALSTITQCSADVDSAARGTVRSPRVGGVWPGIGWRTAPGCPGS